MKTCFKCKRSLPRSEFYVHRMMGDGLLGKCKDCTKSDTKKRIARVKRNPEWVAAERNRCREKAERNRLAGRVAPPTPGASRKWRAANPQKYKAHVTAANAVRCGKLIPVAHCEDCGHEAKLQKHHADYSKPLAVEWLCSKCHGKRHWKK